MRQRARGEVTASMRAIHSGVNRSATSSAPRLLRSWSRREAPVITVLTRGRVLAEGNYETVSNNPEVREAYMGTGHA